MHALDALADRGIKIHWIGSREKRSLVDEAHEFWVER